MKEILYWIGALVLLLVAGSFIYQITYNLRTGRDLATDRLKALSPCAGATLRPTCTPAPCLDPINSLA